MASGKITNKNKIALIPVAAQALQQKLVLQAADPLTIID